MAIFAGKSGALLALANTSLSSPTRTVINRYARHRGIPPGNLEDNLDAIVDSCRYPLSEADKVMARLHPAMNNSQLFR
jgi:hypothetical protein